METAQALRPFADLSSARELLDLSKKATLIRVRWPFTIVCSYLLLYSQSAPISPAAVHGFVLLYLSSNFALYFIDEHYFDSFYLFTPLVVFDTLFFTTSLAISGAVNADFYVVCFATIFLCCICRDLRGLIGVAVLSPLLYGYFLMRSTDLYEPTIYLRIIFPFVIALFYGYFAEVERLQMKLKNQTDAATRNAQLYDQAKARATENALLLERLSQNTRMLERANRVKDEFLGVMSHELRTPLNVVMGYAGLLKDQVFGDISPTQAEAVAKIMNRAKEQLTMITDILEVTRMEAGGERTRIQEVSLVALLDDLRSHYEVPAGKELALAWDYPADLPVVKTDGEKLKHILQNLSNNAIKFTHAGAVTISARAGTRDQESGIGNQGLGVSPNPQSLNPDSSFVEFKVSDTGVGISPAHLPYIFDRFHQIDSSDTRLYGGVGMGLYIVKIFTEMLGGKIQVASVPGRGSTFTVTLPYENTERF